MHEVIVRNKGNRNSKIGTDVEKKRNLGEGGCSPTYHGGTVKVGNWWWGKLYRVGIRPLFAIVCPAAVVTGPHGQSCFVFRNSPHSISSLELAVSL